MPPDLAGLVLGASQITLGLDFFFRPAAASAIPARLGLSPQTVGSLFVAAGAVLVLAQIATRLPAWLRWAGHIFAGLVLLGFWAALSALLDPAYWVLGAAVVLRATVTLFLPLIGDRASRLDRDALWPRLALALVTATLVPLLLVVTIVVGAEFAADSIRARQAAFGATIITAGLFAFAGFGLAIRLARPLEVVTLGVDRLARGERPVEMDLRQAPSEVIRLASAVGVMADTLDARAAERERLALETAVLEERQRLARDLHDSVSQALFGITLAAHSALTHWEDKPELARSRLEQTQLLARTAQAQMRALIFELRPDQLETDGLVKALELQTRALAERREFVVDVELCAEPDMPLNVKEAFYRIAQEALQNAATHARPRALALSLAHANNKVTLTVKDDGVGFDPQATYPGHLGLRSMRERAERVGARFSVESSPAGSCVSLVYNARLSPGDPPGTTDARS